MNLRLTARDGAGGVNSDDIVVTVSGSAGPFSLLSPNGGEVVGESKTIRWDVSETDKAPINRVTGGNFVVHEWWRVIRYIPGTD